MVERIKRNWTSEVDVHKVLLTVKMMCLGIVLLVIPRIAAFVAHMFNYNSIDPDGAFMWISVHHTVQALLVLLIIFIIKKIKPIDFSLGFKNKEIGLRYVKRFVIGFTMYTICAFIISIAISGVTIFEYPLHIRNITGYLGFQLLLSGPSEELLFRAFAITLFVTCISAKRLNTYLSFAVLFSAIIFGIAHIRISYNPFELSYSLQQVFYAMGLGYFYGDCYEKSKSVIYPMVMHSFTNILMVGTTMFLSHYMVN